MQGEPQAQFEEGENFQFQFITENTGNDKYQLPIPWFFPVANDEFFALYRRSQESGGKASAFCDWISDNIAAIENGGDVACSANTTFNIIRLGLL